MPIAFFKLKDRHSVDAALELLRSLDVIRMLRHAATAVATTNAGSQDGTSAKVTVVGDDDRGRVPLLFVLLIGLSATRYNVARNPNWAESVPMDSTNDYTCFLIKSSNLLSLRDSKTSLDEDATVNTKATSCVLTILTLRRLGLRDELWMSMGMRFKNADILISML